MPGPCGRTMTLRSLLVALSSMPGRERVSPASDTPRRNQYFSPLRVVTVTSKWLAPTLAKQSSIAHAALRLGFFRLRCFLAFASRVSFL